MTEDIRDLIERSSLGTPSAKALRESVPVELGQEIVRRANAARAPGVAAVLRRAGSELNTCTEAIRAEVANLDRAAIKAALDRVRQAVGDAVPVAALEAGGQP